MHLIRFVLGILLSASLHPDGAGVLFSVQSDAPRHLYVLASATPGLSVEPIQFTCDIAAGGDSCGGTVTVMPRPNAYTGPEYVTIAVWDNTGDPPVAVQRIDYPRSPYPHIYIPIMR